MLPLVYKFIYNEASLETSGMTFFVSYGLIWRQYEYNVLILWKLQVHTQTEEPVFVESSAIFQFFKTNVGH
jgi:succinate-acetate transporter protein